MTSSFSDKGRAAVLDRSVEISRSEIHSVFYISISGVLIKTLNLLQNSINL